MRKKSWRRKSWRRIKSHGNKRYMIRKICCCVLIWEVAFFVREEGRPILAFNRWEEDGFAGQERVYGIRVRLEDGVVEFYYRGEADYND